MPMKIAIAGASGRMGQMLIEATLGQPDLALAAALDRTDSPVLGRDCGEAMGKTTGVRVSGELAALAGADVLIDFTRPEATLRHLDACVFARREDGHRHDGFRRCGQARHRSRVEAHRHRLRAEHERRRQCDLQADRTRRPHARRRLRHRDHRGASPAQGRCAVGHGAENGRGRRRGARPPTRPNWRSTRAKAIPASAVPARSVSQRSAAATSSATTR